MLLICMISLFNICLCFFSNNEIISLLIFLLLIGLAYSLISILVFSLQFIINNIYVFYASGLIFGIVLYIGPVILAHFVKGVHFLNAFFNALCIRNIIEIGINSNSLLQALLSYLIPYVLYLILSLISFHYLRKIG